MRVNVWLTPLATLLAGLVIGYAVAPSSKDAPQEAATPAPQKVVRPDAKPEEVMALKARIAGLEDSLSRSRKREQEQAEKVATAEAKSAQPPSPKQWLEDLKANNPQEYERIMKFREQMQARLKDQEKRQKAHYQTLDVESMDEERRKNYEQTLAMIKRLAELRSAMMGDDDSARPDWREIRETHRQAHELFTKERRYQLRELGQMLGYDGEEFESSVQTIFDNTSLSFGGPPPMGRREGPPPPPPPGN